uniref:Uncharacterized protein n=1 Tax=Strongyloides papillosus TaxID=174720 RepID=A0A0N5BKM8_STREA
MDQEKLTAQKFIDLFGDIPGDYIDVPNNDEISIILEISANVSNSQMTNVVSNQEEYKRSRINENVNTTEMRKTPEVSKPTTGTKNI